MRHLIGQTIALLTAMVALASCGGEYVNFSQHNPCVPSLEFELTREADGFLCPCRSLSTPNSVCRATYNRRGDNESVILHIGGEYYGLEVTLHPDVEVGDHLKVHDISNLNYDERGELSDPEADEAWVSLGLPHASQAEYCGDDVSDEDYPRMVSDIEGSIRIEEYRVLPDEEYLNISLDLDSMVLVTPDQRWRFAGSADIEAGLPPAEASPDDSSGGGGGGEVDCQQKCEYEMGLCEQNRMLGCYCGSACLCQCALDYADLSSEEEAEYESCVEQNRANAELIEDEDGDILTEGSGSGDEHICDVL